MTLRIDRLHLWDGAERAMSEATLVVEEGRIAYLGPASSAPESAATEERIDGQGKLAIPGLINAHTHLYSSLARGMSIPGFQPTTFTEVLEQLWWKLDKALDPESVRSSALIGALEAARCGITTLIDHHASPNAIPGSLDAMKQAVVDDVGLRAVLCYELTDRDGAERRDAGVDENARFLASGTSEFVAAQFGLHASFTVSDQTLERVAGVIPDGAGVHIHVAEGPEDETACVQEHGVRIAHRLDRFGLLRPRSLLAHCLHVDGAEKDLIAERDAMVVHNPRSNMNNGVGLFDAAGFRARGALVGLGTDGLGANMLAELFTAAILQKHAQADPLAAPFDALHQMLFANNPAIVERLLGVQLGKLVTGAPADIALLAYDPPTPWRSDNALGHLLFGPAVHTLHVSDLFVAGRPVLREDRFVGIDEQAVRAEARQISQRLWRRLGIGGGTR